MLVSCDALLSSGSWLKGKRCKHRQDNFDSCKIDNELQKLRAEHAALFEHKPRSKVSKMIVWRNHIQPIKQQIALNFCHHGEVAYTIHSINTHAERYEVSYRTAKTAPDGYSNHHQRRHHEQKECCVLQVSSYPHLSLARIAWHSTYEANPESDSNERQQKSKTSQPDLHHLTQARDTGTQKVGAKTRPRCIIPKARGLKKQPSGCDHPQTYPCSLSTCRLDEGWVTFVRCQVRQNTRQ